MAHPDVIAAPSAAAVPPGISAMDAAAPAAPAPAPPAAAPAAPPAAAPALALTHLQCLDFIHEQTSNIANNRPLERLRNPLPGGRSIRPFGQQYNQIRAHCIRTEPYLRGTFETIDALNSNIINLAAAYSRRTELEQAIRSHPHNQNAPPTSRSFSLSVTDSPIQNPDDYLQECTSKFHNLPTPFTSLGNKLVKICNKLVNKNRCSTESAGALHRKLVNVYHSNPRNMQSIFIENVVKGQELKLLFQECVNVSPQVLTSMFKQKLHHHIFRYEIPLGADYAPGAGPSRNFMQAAANQVFSSGFFKLAEEGSSRVIINKTVNLVPLGLENTQLHREVCFRTLGILFAFLMLNGIKYDLHLNHYIQARMLFEKQKIKDDAIIMYYLLAFPGDRNARVNLLKNPEHIDGLMFDFNDEVMLDPTRNEEQLSRANFTDHLKLLAKKKLEIDETETLLDEFLRGFFVSREVLRAKKVNMFALDLLMTGSEVTEEHIEKIITKIRRPYPSISSIPQYIVWFFHILLYDRHFPRELAREQPTRYAQSPEEFKRQLLFWWTGTYYYNESLNYSITLGNGVGEYFRAHTCFSSMDFPAHIPSRKHMYEQLMRQVCETEFTMY